MTSDIILPTTKLLISGGVAGVLWVGENLAETIPFEPSWVQDYGFPGAICLVLFYAVKQMFTINQNLQRDRMADRVTAEKERLQDRDTFFEKLEGHFTMAMKDRGELIHLNKEQVTAIERLTEAVKSK
jgi:hypothetical protein